MSCRYWENSHVSNVNRQSSVIDLHHHGQVEKVLLALTSSLGFHSLRLIKLPPISLSFPHASLGYHWHTFQPKTIVINKVHCVIEVLDLPQVKRERVEGARDAWYSRKFDLL